VVGRHHQSGRGLARVCSAYGSGAAEGGSQQGDGPSTHRAARSEQQGALLHDLLDAEVLERQRRVSLSAVLTAGVCAIGMVSGFRFDGVHDARSLQEVRGRVVLAVLGDEPQAFAGRHPSVPLLAAQPVADLGRAQTTDRNGA